MGGGEAWGGIWRGRWRLSSTAHLWTEGKWTCRQEGGARFYSLIFTNHCQCRCGHTGPPSCRGPPLMSSSSHLGSRSSLRNLTSRSLCPSCQRPAWETHQWETTGSTLETRTHSLIQPPREIVLMGSQLRAAFSAITRVAAVKASRLSLCLLCGVRVHCAGVKASAKSAFPT